MTKHGPLSRLARLNRAQDIVSQLDEMSSDDLRRLSLEVNARLAVDPALHSRDTRPARERLFRILMSIYGRIVARELEKKPETLGRILADRRPYKIFLEEEMFRVLEVVGDFEPGPSLLERQYARRISDERFDDTTAKNMLLALRLRWESVFDEGEFRDSEKLKQALEHLRRISVGWNTNFASFNLQENSMHIAILAMVKKIADDPPFYRFARALLEQQSLAVVSGIHDLFTFALEDALRKEQRLRAELAQHKEQMDSELSIARKIQMSLLPVSLPTQGLRFFNSYKPMTTVGGDFYDVAYVRNPDPASGDPGAVGIFIADASGHGVPAAFIAAMAKIAWVHEFEHQEGPAGVLRDLNCRLLDKLSGNFLTAFLAVLDLRGRVLRYAAAGHPPAFLIRDGQVISLEVRGQVIGAFADVRIQEREMPFLRGDRLVFYTDGIFEGRTHSGELFGFERLHDAVTGALHLKGDDFCGHIIQTVDAFLAGAAPEDDATLLLVEIEA